MPDVKQNAAMWDGKYSWPDGGEEWSLHWGNSEAQWRASLLPRLQPYLPVSSILEIAPGYGRWTAHLLPLCDRYVGVDLSSQAIEACRERFSTARHAQFFVNDGRTLPGVEDRSIDLAFSFDSLVHVEDDVIEAYLSELSQKLSDNGIAFLHHSNLGEYRHRVERRRRMLQYVPQAVRSEHDLWQNSTRWGHGRGLSMTAPRFEELCRSVGLICIGQEIIKWADPYRHPLLDRPRFIDCISVAARQGSHWDDATADVVRNPYFMQEAYSARAFSRVYRRQPDTR